MSEYINGYRTGKSEAYAIAALVVLKVNDATDAAAILQALAGVANETNECQLLKTEQDGIES